MVNRIIPALLLLLLGSSYVISASADVTLAVPTDVLEDYQSSFGVQPEPVRYDFPGSRRDVVEVILVQRALREGGVAEADLRPMDGYLRILQQLAEGKVALSGTSVWDFDARDMVEHLWVSSPLIRRGEFVVGVYTRAGHPILSQPQDLSALTQYTPVTSRNWKMDWSLLEQMGFSRIQYASSWESMVRMVLAGRADIVLAPFPQGNDLRIVAEDGRYLVPVPGIKVAFPAERVIAVAKNYPSADATFSALQKGLKILREQGEIERAYTQCGFFNPAVAAWTLINP
ncbi:hypothetical protein [Simiduia agarivorans]|uniref:Solute-binding protein family 3/N-terminal domain-containing protein n=1 Tax=Simiduia agarivorans (strain DSM 21679 / JCM 13881 / BCRC 17597 / SA1) TaxID=1117647 RepID=K4KJB7_SIMAS|nr:hypothetical protein [Simiduia agarivorans]AFU98083.1 hypothetical protein M5M_04380 [Simiduia agarivorans SA1 = DSM 21679]